MSATIHTRIYSEMGGVDFSKEPSEIPDDSFAYLENMYRDYACGAGAGIETVPGYRQVAALGGEVHAIHPHPTDSASLLIHAGASLYPYPITAVNREKPLIPAPLRSSEGRFLPLCETASEGAIADGRLYLVDGKSYMAVRDDTLYRVSEEAYCPLLRRNGKDCEQENLLSRRAREEYQLFSLEDYAYVTETGLTFAVSPDGVCTVSRYEGDAETVVLPARATVGLREYAVAGVDSDAFSGNSTVKTLVLSEGISLLAARAFFGMNALETVVLPSTVTVIPSQCFGYCPALTTVYLPRGLTEIGSYAFSESTVLNIHFPGSAAELVGINGMIQLQPLEPVEGLRTFYHSAYTVVRCQLPLHASVTALLGTTIDGATAEDGHKDLILRTVEGEDGHTRAVYLEAPSPDVLYGKTVSFLCLLRDTFLHEVLGKEAAPGSSLAAICGCTRLVRFDDRLFLSGNPALPGVVFYTGIGENGRSDPSYIGYYHCFTDGDGRAAVRALLATPTALFVMTEDVPGLPALYCHEGRDTGDDLLPRIYPAAEGIGGIACLGAAMSFLGDHVFLSERGLDAIEKSALCEERGIVHRSSAVDARLLREKLEKATLFRYGTYLGIAVQGNVYLADGRRFRARGGHAEYDWYYLSGIGSYEGDEPRYRFLTGEVPKELADCLVEAEDGATVPLECAAAEGYADGLTVHSFETETLPVSYVIREGRALLVSTDGERYGGTFCPATAFYECRGLLFFGTTGGVLAVFNTDKRGDDGLIPRAHYHFCHHAYLSGCATKLDNCGSPARRKTTVRTGGAVRLKAMTGSKLEVRVRTEEGPFTVADTLYGGRGDFGEIDFATAEFHLGDDTVLPLREAKRRWVEKQLYFVSEDYQRPFGILSVAYQWRDAGRI